MLLDQIGEFGLIRKFISNLPPFPRAVVVGPGDDAAVVCLGRARQASPLLLLTTDMMIEGVHFRKDWMTAREIGDKSMRVNLSDIAAMGGIPKFALVSVGLPKKMSVEEAGQIVRGITQAARESGVAVVGGDTNASPKLVINVAVLGEARGRFLTRKGARSGDFLYVTGTLGDSSLGLHALQRRKRSGFKKFIRRHLSPPLRIAVGERLAGRPQVHAMIDLSDGLIGDLGHILEASGVGAEVWVDHLPRSAGFADKAKSLRLGPLSLQLTGGEDYELLFTASPRTRIPRKIDGVPVTKIGMILSRKAGLRLVDRVGHRYFQRKFKGFSHFSERGSSWGRVS